MRPPRRRSPLEHVLVAGDVSDLVAIRALLALLPPATYGQVYVETPTGHPAPDVAAPRRVTVTVLECEPGQTAGERLGRAVQGWLSEWIPEEPEPERDTTIWVGATARERIDTVATCLERL